MRTMPPDSGNIAPSSAYVNAIVLMTIAPITYAQIASGPAMPAARHAPNSQPEPMIEPNPVSINANGPTSRRIAEFVDIRTSQENDAAIVAEIFKHVFGNFVGYRSTLSRVLRCIHWMMQGAR